MKIRVPKHTWINLYTPSGTYYASTYSVRDCQYEIGELTAVERLKEANERIRVSSTEPIDGKYGMIDPEYYWCYELPKVIRFSGTGFYVPVQPCTGIPKDMACWVQWITFEKKYTFPTSLPD